MKSSFLTWSIVYRTSDGNPRLVSYVDNVERKRTSYVTIHDTTPTVFRNFHVYLHSWYFSPSNNATLPIQKTNDRSYTTLQQCFVQAIKEKRREQPPSCINSFCMAAAATVDQVRSCQRQQKGQQHQSRRLLGSQFFRSSLSLSFAVHSRLRVLGTSSRTHLYIYTYFSASLSMETGWADTNTSRSRVSAVVCYCSVLQCVFYIARELHDTGCPPQVMRGE